MKKKMVNFVTWLKALFNGNIKPAEDELSAEKAWIESSYGRGTYHDVKERIKNKQSYIRRLIKSKCCYEYGNPAHMYRCVVDIEDDLKHNIDEILQPFRDGGFNVINLTAAIPELKEENVFLISWKHVFDRKS